MIGILSSCNDRAFEEYFVDLFFEEGESADWLKEQLEKANRQDLLPLMEICRKGTEDYDPIRGSWEWDYDLHKLVEERED
jgi:uncharacterized Zn finger protein